MIRVRAGLQVKFILLTSLLILLTALTLSRFFLAHLERRESSNLEALGLTISRNLAHNAELGLFSRNREMLTDLCEGPLEREDVAYIRILDEGGQEIVALYSVPDLAPRLADGHTPPAAWRHPSPQGEVLPVRLYLPQKEAVAGIEVRVPVLTAGASGLEDVGFLLEESSDSAPEEVLGAVVVGLSLERSLAEIGRLRGAFSMLTGLVVLLAVLLTILIVQVVVQPIKRMAAATSRIAEGDLEESIVVHTKDEVGDLARSFNRMTQKLRGSRDALERYSAELEEMVKQRTVQLEQAQSQLVQAEKMSAMGELVSGVAHELNNPLAGVIGYSQLLLGEEVPERARRGLDRINREAERCKRIVQNLQVFARKHMPQKNYVGINGILQSTIDLRAYQMQVDNVEVTTHLQDDLPKTMADFHQLQQVFMNLLVNAHHAIKSAGRHGRIEVQSGELNGQIVVRVSDNGCGIPQDSLSKVFDPFFTTKEVGQGTGLGLSICYGIIQEHRGRIYATSRVGEGSTITVELPILQPRQEEMEAEQAADDSLLSRTDSAGQAAPEPAASPAGPQPTNILVIDDEASIVDILHETLRLDGHRVDTANNGSVALRKLQTETYDVIISDLRMPGMDGEELYNSVRAISPDLARRIIFSTGDVANQEAREFLERTGNPYLQKPFELSTMRKIVAQMTEAGH
jgi:signal transduction histidine kinase/ActR/RegA family two-component response regulator